MDFTLLHQATSDIDMDASYSYVIGRHRACMSGMESSLDSSVFLLFHIQNSYVGSIPNQVVVPQNSRFAPAHIKTALQHQPTTLIHPCTCNPF